MQTKASKATPTSGPDAIAMLTADHKAVKALFKEFEGLADNENANEQKLDLVQKICDELTVHAEVEEEIFYPAVRAAIDDEDLLDEAEVEHATLKDLIGQLEGMNADDDLYNAKVTVLSEYVEHHVKEEEGEMFPKAREADLDTAALGAEMASRKSELKSELGMLDDEADEPPQPKAGNGSKRAGKQMR